MRMKAIGWILALLFVAGSLAGCEVDRTTGERTLTGSIVGAAGGATAGLIGGNFLQGALTGAAAGATSGFVYDQLQKR